MAPSSASQDSGGRISIVGIEITCAPSPARASPRTLACSRARVMTMRRPNRGSFSNQFNLSRSRATSPTTMRAGGPSEAAFSEMSLSVPLATSWAGHVPQRMTDTRVPGSRPCSTRDEVISGRFLAPMKNTSVPVPGASRAQSIEEKGFFGSSCPVMNVTVEPNSRCVKGMPA